MRLEKGRVAAAQILQDSMINGLVKSQKVAIFENSHLTNSVSYKAEFGKI